MRSHVAICLFSSERSPPEILSRKKIKLPALKREGVYFSDQVKKRVQDLRVARAAMETRVTKKRD